MPGQICQLAKDATGMILAPSESKTRRGASTSPCKPDTIFIRSPSESRVIDFATVSAAM